MSVSTENAIRVIMETSAAVEIFQRHLHPPHLDDLVRQMVPLRDALSAFLSAFRLSADSGLRESLEPSLDLLDETMGLITSISTNDMQEMMGGIMKASRKFSRMRERLYPLRDLLPGLEPLFAEDGAERTVFSALRDRTGLFHSAAGDDPYARGGCSLYVPDSYDGLAWPLVVALHGGWGHGRDFLWAWQRAAGAGRFLLAAPSSRERTWSIHDPEADRDVVMNSIDFASRRARVDTARVYATGFSDGGTYALALHFREDTPFAACAPVSATVPRSEITGAKDKRILWTHGSLDWMFPLWRAEHEAEILRIMGADLTFRQVKGLSHTYPVEENASILEWFGGNPEGDGSSPEKMN